MACADNHMRQEDRLRSLEGKLGVVIDHLGYETLVSVDDSMRLADFN
jgi:hypothetical protein